MWTIVVAAALWLALTAGTGCTINRAQHYAPDGTVDASLYRSTFMVNATAVVSWDGERFTFDYNQTTPDVVKAMQAVAPLLQQAALAGESRGRAEGAQK
jgi:hypothetical protein